MLFDTNVLLDLVLGREPWATDASMLLDAAATGKVEGYLAGHAITTIHYVVERARDRPTALTAVADLLSVLHVAKLGRADFQRALTFGFGDYEDAVQAAACLRVGAQFLVTSNPKDFRYAPVAILSAGEVLALLGVLGSDA